MSLANAPGAPEPRRSLFSAFIQTFALCACAQYATPEAIEYLMSVQNKRSRPARAAAAKQASERGGPRWTAWLCDPWRSHMHENMQRLLRRPSLELTARVALTLPFWGSGLSKLIDFNGGVTEMTRAGLEPAALFNIATIATQLVGSLLIITGRRVWMGAGALGVFTALTILLVHRFWIMTEEPFRTIAFHTVVEHVGIIGGLIAIAILSARPTQSDRQAL
jgi:transmembrane protein